jgi:hypothetical protein
MPFARYVGIARVGLGGREAFAGVLDQARPRGDGARSEGAESLDRRRANLERIVVVGQESGTFSVFCSTCVTPPEMMNAITSAASASMRCT